MSKFDELWQIYIGQAERYTQYKNSCVEFIRKCVPKIITKLEWSTDKAGFVVLTKPIKYVNYRDGLSEIEKILLPGEGETWRFGIRLQLWEEILPT